jgi:glycosyltransferase involved in cell wall biosynthesis
MKLAILIPTYQRKDGKSKYFLTRALKSIRNQTHKDYKVFLIGDKYEDDEEFKLICTSIIDPKNIYYENLSYAKERDIYSKDPEKLWCSGGVNAINHGIEKALSEGYEYICHLDHDDYWLPNHLSSISSLVEENPDKYVFTCSYCNYLGKQRVPYHSQPGEYYPVEGDLTHSATCVNFSKIDLRYRDVNAETGKPFPADADLWIRLSNHMRENNLKGFLLNYMTVVLDKKETE